MIERRERTDQSADIHEATIKVPLLLSYEQTTPLHQEDVRK
jgi:hypothetical protein